MGNSSMTKESISFEEEIFNMIGLKQDDNFGEIKVY